MYLAFSRKYHPRLIGRNHLTRLALPLLGRKVVNKNPQVGYKTAVSRFQYEFADNNIL